MPFRFLIGFLIGAAIGASIALAIAPQPGTVVRQQLWDQVSKRTGSQAEAGS